MAGVGNLHTVDLAIVIGFLVLVSIVGFVLSSIASGDIEDYFLGDNEIPWWILGISTSTSNFDMAGTMLIVALVFSLGYKGLLVEIRGGVGIALAFLMVFLGKWLRRSRVMTSAEWMKLRFGVDRQGKVAHIASTLAYVVLMVGMIAYFAEGAGKFLTAFLPFTEFQCTAGMVGVGLLYTLLSGLYGVVFTDVIQMVILLFTAVYITIHAYTIAPDVTLPEGFLALDLAAPSGDEATAMLSSEMGTSALHLFGVAVFAWLARSVTQGMGGVGGYTDQRFFAARSEREASLLSMESIVLSVFRWTLVAGLVVMAMGIIQRGAPGAEMIANDAEQVLPVVLGQLLPVGLKGLVIAGLIAAAMSTFDSTLNAGASYIVKDVYETYVNPDADPENLVWMSRAATVGMCVAGVGFAVIIPNIRSIWGIITMGLGPGLFVPLFFRWYWPRLNGYGFAAGTAVGATTGIVIAAGSELPVYIDFPIIIGAALVATVGTTYATPATDERLLVNFWHQINPWGFWGRYEEVALEKDLISREEYHRRKLERIYDFIALAFAIPFQLALLVGGMALVFHDWKKFAICSVIVVLTSIGLYFSWFRNLKPNEETDLEDEYFEGVTADVAAGELEVYDVETTLRAFKDERRADATEGETTEVQRAAREAKEAAEQARAAAEETKRAVEGASGTLASEDEEGEVELGETEEGDDERGA